MLNSPGEDANWQQFPAHTLNLHRNLNHPCRRYSAEPHKRIKSKMKITIKSVPEAPHQFIDTFLRAQLLRMPGTRLILRADT